MLPYMQFPLICLSSLFRSHTALSLPSIPLANPPLSLILNPAASNISKPTSDTFPIPDTDLVLIFSVFGPILEVAQLNILLTQAQDDIGIQIDQHGADALTPADAHRTWRTEDIALEVYQVTTYWRLTLGQFRSLIEGLGLYMIQSRRSREAKFRLLRVEGVTMTTLAGGDIWMITGDD